MFASRGVSTGGIAALLFTWSAVAFLLEVPTGALADRWSRRRVLAVAQVVRAAGFLVWWCRPTFTGYLVGFVLWGVESALTSGAFEALVYDELRAQRREAEYARLMARAEQCALAGLVAGGLLAAALVPLGYGPVLLGSVLAGLIAAVVVATFPETPRVAEAGSPRYLTLLREGVHYSATHAPVRRLVLFSGAVFGLAGVDEFFGLLLRDVGITNAGISVWQAVFFGAAAVGSVAASRLARGSRGAMVAITVVLGATLLLAGWGSSLVVPVALAVFSTLTCVQGVALDAQLQAAIGSEARATITSVQGVTAELVALLGFAGFGLVSGAAGNGAGTVVVAVAILLVAAAYGLSGRRAGRRPAFDPADVSPRFEEPEPGNEEHP
jgi:predicted MFS family arabinose efflux permease